MTKSRGINGPRKRWTEVEVELLRRNYADTRTGDLATALGRDLQHVYAKAKKLGLAKSQAYLDSPAACRLRRGDEVGKAYRFQKGIVPANKGLRRPGFAPGDMAKTQFKKGVKGRNWMPLGSHRINGDGYLDRKVSDTGYPPDDWKCVHRLIWIEAHGPIPDGHLVAFKVGRRSTVLEQITLDSIELLTKREVMQRNTIHNMPKELVDITLLRGRLSRAINKRAKEAETT